MSELKKQAAKGVMWSAIERFSVQGIQYVLSIIIARILMPADYGLIAILTVFVAISQTFVDGGLANALIQKKNRTETDYSTVFCFNAALAVILYMLMFAFSPLIASFFEEPQLEPMTKIMGLVLVINSLGIIQQTRLTVALDFKRQAVASLTAAVVSGGVGIFMAYHGFGAWALVGQTLLNNLCRVVLLWVFAKWSPSLRFSRDSFRELFPFGSKLLISSLLHTLYVNAYSIIIGKKFADVQLGFFNRASTLAQFPSTNFTNVIVRAVYPIQCRLQDDNQALNSSFIAYLRMACYIVFPIMTVLCALAEPLTSVVLTDKWLPIVPYFQLLSIAYMWDPVMKINHNMLNVKGRSDYFLKAEIIKKIIAVGILVSTIPLGIIAMCIGLIAYAFADMCVIIYYTRKLTGIGYRKQIQSIYPVFLLAASTGLVCYAVYLVCFSLNVATLPSLLIGGFVGLAFFLGASHVFRFRELQELLSLLRSRTGK